MLQDVICACVNGVSDVTAAFLPLECEPSCECLVKVRVVFIKLEKVCSFAVLRQTV